MWKYYSACAIISAFPVTKPTLFFLPSFCSDLHVFFPKDFSLPTFFILLLYVFDAHVPVFLLFLTFSLLDGIRTFLLDITRLFGRLFSVLHVFCVHLHAHVQVFLRYRTLFSQNSSLCPLERFSNCSTLYLWRSSR